MNKEPEAGPAVLRERLAHQVPGSCYRLQLNGEFTFSDALAITGYLHELGITDCYASPIFEARPRSMHGYDVCNWHRLNPNIGDQPSFDAWTKHLRELGMGLLLDIVPNHMAADLRNPWWRDVLMNGEASEFARWFDIDWTHHTGTSGKVLLPVLEEPYCKTLESAKLQVVFQNGDFHLMYHQTAFPLSPDSLVALQQEILRLCREEARSTESLDDLNALGEVAMKLAAMTAVAEDGSRITSLGPGNQCGPGAESWPALERALLMFNGQPGIPESFNALHALIQQQHYRLAYWRIGNDELNYRRFFDVAELVAMRMELPEVFQATHEVVAKFIRERKLTGLRVDHPDGLWDPKQYFQRLQEACRGGSPVDAWNPLLSGKGNSQTRYLNQGLSTAPSTSPLFIVAEKILTGDEPLPEDWPVAGTTGYEFLNLVNGLFVNSANRSAIEALYAEFTGQQHPFASMVYSAKLQLLQTSMKTDLQALCRLLQSIAVRTRYGIDFTRAELETALASTVAAFPVYRTYITERSTRPSSAERVQIEEALRLARLANPTLVDGVFSFLHRLLFLSPPADLEEMQTCREFIMKFQQLTGPVMAKGLEDTVFYRYNCLISLNEVGGDPGRFGTELEHFHQQNEHRAARWPHSLVTTATHDTKRGEDLRARINVLSEMPEEWRQAVLKWSRLNADKKTNVDGAPAPSANDEYLLYQTLVGAWVSAAENGNGMEAFRQRIDQYMLKAIREAKDHTSWTSPSSAYEQATHHFLQAVLTPSHNNPFLDDFMLFQRKLGFFGLFNSLGQVVLKSTAPGVPDFYQGSELWDYSLVDPDNRRPVDYGLRRELFRDLQQKLHQESCDVPALVKQLVKNYQSGQVKLYVMWRLLELRRRRRHLFEQGGYRPITARGDKGLHICAYARESSGEQVITVSARLLLSLTKGSQRGALEPEVWLDTTLPIPGGRAGDQYQDIFSRQIITLQSEQAGLPVREILAFLPVAVLERVQSSAK